MDAISFVLGEKTSNLRVRRLSVSTEVLLKIGEESGSLGLKNKAGLDYMHEA